MVESISDRCVGGFLGFAGILDVDEPDLLGAGALSLPPRVFDSRTNAAQG